MLSTCSLSIFRCLALDNQSTRQTCACNHYKTIHWTTSQQNVRANITISSLIGKTWIRACQRATLSLQIKGIIIYNQSGLTQNAQCCMYITFQIAYAHQSFLYGIFLMPQQTKVCKLVHASVRDLISKIRLFLFLLSTSLQ